MPSLDFFRLKEGFLGSQSPQPFVYVQTGTNVHPTRKYCTPSERVRSENKEPVKFFEPKEGNQNSLFLFGKTKRKKVPSFIGDRIPIGDYLVEVKISHGGDTNRHTP